MPRKQAQRIPLLGKERENKEATLCIMVVGKTVSSSLYQSSPFVHHVERMMGKSIEQS